MNTVTKKYDYGDKYGSEYYKTYYAQHKETYMDKQRERRAKVYVMPLRREFQRLSAIQV